MDMAWTEEECPGTGNFAAKMGDPMGWCVKCRKLVRTNGAGKLSRHTVSVNTKEADRTEGIDGVHPLQHLINKSVRPPDYEEDSRGWWADKLALGEITNEEFLKRWPKKTGARMNHEAALREASRILRMAESVINDTKISHSDAPEKHYAPFPIYDGFDAPQHTAGSHTADRPRAHDMLDALGEFDADKDSVDEIRRSGRGSNFTVKDPDDGYRKNNQLWFGTCDKCGESVTSSQLDKGKWMHRLVVEKHPMGDTTRQIDYCPKGDKTASKSAVWKDHSQPPHAHKCESCNEPVNGPDSFGDYVDNHNQTYCARPDGQYPLGKHRVTQKSRQSKVAATGNDPVEQMRPVLHSPDGTCQLKIFGRPVADMPEQDAAYWRTKDAVWERCDCPDCEDTREAHDLHGKWRKERQPDLRADSVARDQNIYAEPGSPISQRMFNTFGPDDDY
jgi:hypothetical protein